jgi:hypothetical protein
VVPAVSRSRRARPHYVASSPEGYVLPVACPNLNISQLSHLLPGLADNGPNTQTSWIDAFKADAAAGTLPAVSILVGPAELSEHPQNRPNDGAWQTQQIINALIMSPSWETSVLILSYDGEFDLLPTVTFIKFIRLVLSLRKWWLR